MYRYNEKDICNFNKYEAGIIFDFDTAQFETIYIYIKSIPLYEIH